MQQELGFDIISDLMLTPEECFNWEGKATSLYCIVAGNVSSDFRTTIQTLTHISKFYQGVFYIMGDHEYSETDDILGYTERLLEYCSRIPNLAVLYHHVIIVDGVAVLGCNGWDTEKDVMEQRLQDIVYLKKSIEKLQRHLDVKKIIIVSNGVPNKDLYFGEVPYYADDMMPLDYCLESDTEFKVTNWIFGKYEKIVDTRLNGINYVNNPYYKRIPYWAKRISIPL